MTGKLLLIVFSFATGVFSLLAFNHNPVKQEAAAPPIKIHHPYMDAQWELIRQRNDRKCTKHDILVTATNINNISR